MDTDSAAAPRRISEPVRRGLSKPRPHRLPGMAEPSPVPRGRLRRERRRARLVLIVDDAVHTRELYTEYLTYCGLGVVGAADAETGLALAQRLRPDIIVMDIAMP